MRQEQKGLHGSMNPLGFSMTVQRTGQRDPHISKVNDKQLAQNICGVWHFVCTGWLSTSLQIGHIYSSLNFSTNCSGWRGSDPLKLCRFFTSSENENAAGLGWKLKVPCIPSTISTCSLGPVVYSLGFILGLLIFFLPSFRKPLKKLQILQLLVLLCGGHTEIARRVPPLKGSL